MISVLLAVIGWLIAGRTFRILVDHQITRSQNPRRWLLLQINFVLICAYLGLLHPHLGFFLLAALILAPIFISVATTHRNERKFQNETVELYDSLLMGVRGGRSIREVLIQTGKEERWSHPHRETVAYIVKNSEKTFPNQHIGMKLRARELSLLLNSGSRVADRLKFYRDQWSLCRRLRLKVKVATKQTQVQALVVLLLYIIVAAFQVFHDLQFLTSKWFTLGSLLLVLGLYLMARLRRSFVWKT